MAGIIEVNLWVPWTLYALATLSPGPATLAIMATSAESGRRSGINLALGVSLGSLFWALCAANGLVLILNSLAWSLTVLKIAGGLYLLWIGWKSIRSAIRPTSPLSLDKPNLVSGVTYFMRGLLIHLLNPKAIFGWLAVITVGLDSASVANSSSAFLVVLICWPFGLAVFLLHAVAFSSNPVVFIYQRCKRTINAMVGTAFTIAGLKLLSSSWK